VICVSTRLTPIGRDRLGLREAPGKEDFAGVFCAAQETIVTNRKIESDLQVRPEKNPPAGKTSENLISGWN
jgi:hypothetical protein